MVKSLIDRSAQNRIRELRIFSVGAMFALFYVVVLLRSYQLQILGNSRLNNLVESQYKTNLVIQPRRGTIYDRNGEVLAMDVMVASIGVHPHLIGDKKAVADLLADNMDLSRAEIEKKLASNKRFLWVERRIPLEAGEKIAKPKHQGVQVVHEFRRYYPNKKLAGALLGAVGYDAKALGGLELAYDHYLKSESQLTQAERDARGKLFSLGEDADGNYDLYLSIDKNIQHIAEDALRENAVKHAVKSGFAIVMDVGTGEILAMANYPEFNPNTYWEYPLSDWKNHAIVDTFEPGSTFKTVLMGAALHSGKVRVNDRFNCEGGNYRIGKHVIHDHGGYGMMSAQEILQVSSNIGVTKIAYKIGKNEFYDFMMNLGFGKKTGIGIAGESGGFIRSPEGWKDIEFSNIAFGQGVSVTGLQMASTYSAFANKGRQMKPYLVRKIVGAEGEEIFERTPEVRNQIMSEEHAEDLKNMLFTVTQPGGTARIAHLEGYFSAGKTGTAQKVDPKLKAYAKGEYVSSFIGFAPLRDPKIAVYVVYDTPRKNGYYGGVAAAPVFKKIAAETLVYSGEAPMSEKEQNELIAKIMPKAKPVKSVEKVAKLRDEVGLKRPLKRLPDQEKIKLAFSDKKMPDLTGMSFRELLKLAQEHGVLLKAEGSGFVARQFPDPGKPFKAEWKVKMGGAEALTVRPPEKKCVTKSGAGKQGGIVCPEKDLVRTKGKNYAAR